MKKSFAYITVLFITCTSAYSQGITTDGNLQPYNKAVVWRGFHHLWSYNHRINRLGSYVYLDSNLVPKGVEYSASGLGSDSTFFQQYYSYVESPHLRFYQGTTKILVTGKETQLLNADKEVTVFVPEWFRGLKRYKTLLNGFEIKSLEKADQPILFEMHLDDPFYSPQSKEIKFNGHVSWVANCRSAECSVFKNSTTYELTIHYLVIGWNDDNAMALEFFNKNSYEWGTSIEPNYEHVKKNYQVVPRKFDNAFMGIKSFGFILNEEQWLQEMKYKVTIDNYEIEKGMVSSDIGMLFLGWKEGMKQKAVSKKEAMFVHKKAGWVSMSVNTSVIQVSKARVVDGETSGSMFWPGRNFASSGNLASKEFILNFNY